MSINIYICISIHIFFFKRKISVTLSEEGYHSQHVGRSIGLLLLLIFSDISFCL